MKAKAAEAYCPVGKWFEENNNCTPLVNPTRNLLFHIFPRIGAEWNWHWHIEQIRKNAHKFKGKICIGIATGVNLENPENVQSMLDGIPVTDWIIKPNTHMAETVTFTDLLRCVQSDDPNTITFRGHCKGVTHRQNGFEFEWARVMWDTCMDIASVEKALSSHLMAGCLKCHKPIVPKNKSSWFYAGTFFWFRNRQIFNRDWGYTEPTRWFAEYWPDVVCENSEAACLFHDWMNRDIRRDWLEIMRGFETWRSART